MRAAYLLTGAAILSIPGVCGAQEADEGAVEPAPGLTAGPPPPGDDGQRLAKQLSNPVASLISVPFQFNIDRGAGPDGRGIKSTLNIQPVVPISLSSTWNVIVRTILPVSYQDDISSDDTNEFGLGDTLQSFFFSPRATGAGGIIWGVGPAFLYPTATDRFLGGKKWGLGPTAVLLNQSGKNTVGILANHLWSVAGDDERADVSATFLQPFFSHTTSTATTYTINTETTYEWKSDRWVVPINLTMAQLTKMGNQPIQLAVGGRYYIEKPVGGPDWGVRFVVTLLFPKR